MTRRIIIKGVHIARIDEDLCAKYEEVCREPIYKNLTRLLEQSFRVSISGKEDILMINERLKALHYNGIGEWYKGVMRSRVTADLGEVVCQFKCKDCAKFNCGEDHPIMSDGGSAWNYCPEWQCGVDGENNRGIEKCFTVRV